ncbi:MAG: GNAT family N-acetyltransferase [Pyrinomonadaceae bacterium]
MELNIRLANNDDFLRLAFMRWDFRVEDGEETGDFSREKFSRECTAFFERGLASGRHFYWLAEIDGEIAAHIFVHIVDLVPRPCKLVDQFGYLTNAFTLAEYRGKGVGTKLLDHVIEWAKMEDLELLIVYPSENAISFL